MKFILNCQGVEGISQVIGKSSDEIYNSISKLSTPNGNGDFDWDGAIDSIRTNITNTSERMKNAQKYLQMVIEKHKELQATFDYKSIKVEATAKLTKIGESDKIIPVPKDPTIKTQSTSTVTNYDNSQTVSPVATAQNQPVQKNVQANVSETTTGVTYTNNYTVPTDARHFTLPAGVGTSYTYMGWQLITARDSNQYRLKEAAGMNFDTEGFGRIDGRYVIACTTTFGKVGDYVDFKLDDGTILKCIIGDIKSAGDTGATVWGHNNGRNVIEFVVDENSWYNKKDNPGTPSNHPEWNHKVVEANAYGNYFTDRRP